MVPTDNIILILICFRNLIEANDVEIVCFKEKYTKYAEWIEGDILAFFLIIYVVGYLLCLYSIVFFLNVTNGLA